VATEQALQEAELDQSAEPAALESAERSQAEIQYLSVGVAVADRPEPAAQPDQESEL
jgi:hypothetical protein